jgi:hypothetical protein
MRQPRRFPLEIVSDHLLVRLKGHAAVIDTGSPLTMRAPSIVAEQLGEPVRWLVGTDLLARERVLLDWTERRAVVGGPPMRGETLPLVPHAGLFQIEVQGDHGSALAFLDSGAHISYAPAASVRDLTPVATERDFYPLYGNFDVSVYELTIRVGRRRIRRARFGVLPELLSMLLSGVGGSGWILGSDFFRDRAIQLDLANNRVIDATVVAPRQRTTPRTVHVVGTDDVSTTPVSELNGGVEGWRGWRLTDVAGTPRLQSVSARSTWDGPCFTSDMLPTLDGARRATGVHAYATPGQMQSLLHGPALVYGQVTLYGEVCVHEMGYRAEHARIDRLFLRACGRHACRPFPRTGLSLFDHLEMQRPGPYCACDDLEPHEWLSYEQLEVLAQQLGDRYQCDVTIDAERSRTSPYLCSHSRSSHNTHARRG